MKDTFYKLAKDKKQNVINSCIEEFANNTYENTSLNNIIKRAKISKGGLFKYIENKKDLYTYILDLIMREVIEYQSNNIDMSKECYFDRISELINLGFEYYKKNPQKYSVILNAFYDISSPCHEEVVLIRKNLIEEYKLNLLEGINWSQYKEDMEKIIKISKYIIDGYNVSFIKKLDKSYSVEILEKSMKEDLDLILNTIKVVMKEK